MTQPTLAQRLQGLLATLALLALVVGLPLLLTAIGAAPWDAHLGQTRTLLTSPDDGTLAMAVIAAAAWIAWLVIAVSFLVEAVSRIRGLPTPTLPGLGVPQRAVGQLVTVAALLFVAAPAVMAAFPTPPTHAATAAPVLDTTRVQTAPVLPEAAPVVARVQSATKHKATIEYTVKRGDSLWKIADRLLGDGTRFREIFDLNRNVLNRPDFITPGTVLKVPYEAVEPESDRPTEEYVVQPSDTLAKIAEAKLGDPLLYPELFAASRHTVQPDGEHLTDPNLIRPGWDITIPGQAKHKAETPEKPPHELTSPASVDPPPQTPAETPTATDDEAESSTPGWVVPGLTGAGAVLAGLVLLAVRAHRNTQLRYRRPGQTIAPPPPELLPVEKTAFVSGAPLAKTIEQLDRALMHLAGESSDAGRALPLLVTATLAKNTVTLRLAEDASLPEPWTGAGREWRLDLAETLPERQDVLAPYPLLVTVGQDDDGGLRLVNLEHLGVVSLTGDSDRALALARHIAAELALNPWSVLVQVDVIGIAEELAALDSLRLHHHATGDDVLPRIARDVTTSRENGWGDPDPFRAVISSADATGDLTPLLLSPTSRIGTVLVSVGAPVPGSTVLDLDKEGRLRAPVLGLDVQVAGLTSDEATACAAIVDLTRESRPVKIAPFEQAADGWRALADQAGALREELTHVREEGPAGDGSLLPGAVEGYVEAASTTVEDVETLAPVVTEQVRRTVEESDPTLDEDIADWFDETQPRPRLQLLGPVRAYARGNVVAVSKRRPYFVELLAYLALHPEGVFSRDLAQDFGIKQSRARTDLSLIRDWLGMNPRNGELFLPKRDLNTPESTVDNGYTLKGLLVDVDLFRRLRTRGQARGADGMDDLRIALKLVGGKPFSSLRKDGWTWLFEGDRHHEIAEHIVVDTAHIVAVAAQARNDLDEARWASEIAVKAAPYDEISRLDLVKVAAAQGHIELAERMLNHDVFNRTDDYLPPIDLPKRTRGLVEKEGWGTTKRRPSA